MKIVLEQRYLEMIAPLCTIEKNHHHRPLLATIIQQMFQLLNVNDDDKHIFKYDKGSTLF